MEYVYKKVEELVKNEITDATERSGLCHSWYEKYAVTLEKLQKCEKEVQITSDYLNSLWFGITESIPEYAEESIQDIYEHAIKAACEAILVAAMAKKEIYEIPDNGTAEISDHAIKIVDSMPTINAQPVKHGQWSECWRDPARNVISVICSACGDASITYLPKRDMTIDDVPKKICIQMPYCPNCGAKMGGDANADS